MAFKIFGFDVLTALIPILIKAAKEICDLVIKGEALNDEMKGVVKTAYFASVEFQDNIVKDPDNSYTDEALAEFQELCRDTAQEGGFELVSPTPN